MIVHEYFFIIFFLWVDESCYFPKQTGVEYRGSTWTAANDELCLNWEDVPCVDGTNCPEDDDNDNVLCRFAEQSEPSCFTASGLTSCGISPCGN